MPKTEKTAVKANAEAKISGVPIRLNVNGKPYELIVKPNWTLQYILHDKLAFTSVKDMCVGKGECGACTVIIDKRPVLSCMTLAIDCEGKDIETAEGIMEAGHPLIEEYAKNHCMQCGYCTPGFLVTAKAFLDRNPDPTVDEIMDALGGNLCRCGTYPRHPIAIMEAAKKLRGGK